MIKQIKITLGLGGGKLIQLAERSEEQMMSYLLLAPDGRLTVIDGGAYCDGDAEKLRREIISFGGHVNAWFITHAHNDHFGALMKIIEGGLRGITVDCLYYSFPDESWFARVEGGGALDFLKRFYTDVESSGIKTSGLYPRERFDFGIGIEVLCVPGDTENYPTVNDSTCVFRASYPERDILFLGDIGVCGERDLIASAGDSLRCDIVQMAHHGQHGADFALYRMIAPKVCLWTAPRWLWENDSGSGRDSGPWETLVTRGWMDELGVTDNYACAMGDFIFE